MRFHTLAEWLHWQESLHPASIDLGLDRVAAVAGRLGLTRPAPVVITVAGTNGKGSCVAFLESMLSAAGYRTGAYTSPHLLRYNERIRVAGVEAGDDALMEAFHAVDQVRRDTSITYFEFGTLAAFRIFEQAGLDVAILEVGLGGRLDAVNVVDPDCALITTIGLDHAEWLGSDREGVALEKAGIMRAGRPVVFGDRDRPSAIDAEAERTGARLFALGRDFDFRAHDDGWTWRHPVNAASAPRTLPRPSLAGDYQLANAAACLMTLESLAGRLAVSDEAVAAGLTATRLAGRLQQVEIGGVETVLDVAHNPQAAASLASALATLPERRPQVAVFAQLADKDHAGVVRALRDRFDHWYLAGLEGERGLSAAELADGIKAEVPGNGLTVCDDVRHALQLAVKATGSSGRVVVFGSFKTVEHVAQGA